ncbi:hypothetical protein ATZ33_17290 [Enterococcus silesiacus]|nr:hypothetical protein ATZ33_17290 [Enterococcus silesiacus]
MIAVIYKEYIDRINNGISKSQAKNLGGGDQLYNLLFPNMLFEDFEDTMRTLSRNEYINVNWSSNKIYLAFLKDDGIIYMENRFKNNVQDVIKFITNIKNIL